MKQATNRILYSYWNDVRRGRIAPTRFEIEPSGISSILSETFILEEGEKRSFAFRLAGTRICEQFGGELKGRDFRWLAGPDAGHVGDIMESVTRDGGVGLLELEAMTDDGRAQLFEVIVLPLVHPADQITRYVGAVSAIDPQAWLGTESLQPSGLVSHDIIWPDGRPHAVILQGQSRPPFAPVYADARVVRSNRRQFRIFDGGRKE
jgi:hypothetical protein